MVGTPHPSPLPQGERGPYGEEAGITLTPPLSRREAESYGGDAGVLSQRERKEPAQREGEGPRADGKRQPKRLLILGGTSEAAQLARRAVAEFGNLLDVTTSLAGRLPSRPDLPGLVRVGGFGGPRGLVAHLAAERIDLLIDATHPFAATISSNAAQACATVEVPRLVLIRPEWRPGPDDHWLDAASLGEAAKLLTGIASRVFLTTGPGGIEAFAESDCWFLVRLFTPPSTPLPLREHEIIVARPPFSREGERELMLRHGIDTLVSKNSGGPTEAKLAAARDLGLRVVMIRRPPPEGYAGETAGTIDDATAWISRHL